MTLTDNLKKHALSLKKEFGITVFVETGAYKGDSAAWACNNFEKVYTCEPIESFYGETMSALRTFTNAKVFNTTSEEMLPEALKEITSNTNCLFWLDAHWSGPPTYGENYECPLVAELKIISTLASNNSVIIIDDAPCFTKPLPPPHKSSHWPTFDEIKNIMNDRDIYFFEEFAICITPHK